MVVTPALYALKRLERNFYYRADGRAYFWHSVRALSEQMLRGIQRCMRLFREYSTQCARQPKVTVIEAEFKDIIYPPTHTPITVLRYQAGGRDIKRLRRPEWNKCFCFRLFFLTILLNSRRGIWRTKDRIGKNAAKNWQCSLEGV